MSICVFDVRLPRRSFYILRELTRPSHSSRAKRLATSALDAAARRRRVLITHLHLFYCTSARARAPLHTHTAACVCADGLRLCAVCSFARLPHQLAASLGAGVFMHARPSSPRTLPTHHLDCFCCCCCRCRCRCRGRERAGASFAYFAEPPPPKKTRQCGICVFVCVCVYELCIFLKYEC